MSRPASAALRKYQTVLSSWPRDTLRPSTQLQDALQKNLRRRTDSPGATADEAVLAKETNVLEALLNDQYKMNFPLSDRILRPQSAPTHFDDLLAELERLPDKSWWSAYFERISGKFRF